MLLLEHDEIAGLLTPQEIIEALRGSLIEQSKGLVQVPPRTTVDSSSGYGWLRMMPAILNGSKVMGFKAMHSTPGVGVGYFVDLYDLPTGELLATMDADWLTAQRTAATAAIAVDILAAKTIGIAGVLGSGEQARSMLTAASKVRQLSKVKVFSPTLAHRQAFAEKVGQELGLDITPVDSPADAVVGCDLLLSVFRAGKEPFVADDWITPGMHICAASSVRPIASGRSVYLEMSARMQMQAMALAGADGNVIFMDDDEVRAAIEMQSYGRAWNLWRQRGLTLVAADRAVKPGRV